MNQDPNLEKRSSAPKQRQAPITPTVKAEPKAKAAPKQENLAQQALGKLLDLWAESVVTQSVIAAITVTTYCALVLTDRTVPDELYLLIGTIVGFYFGARTQFAARRMMNGQTQGKRT